MIHKMYVHFVHFVTMDMGVSMEIIWMDRGRQKVMNDIYTNFMGLWSQGHGNEAI